MINIAEQKTCENCAHFHMHYLLSKTGSYTKAAIGHCDTPRVKPRNFETPACECFKEGIEKKEG